VRALRAAAGGKSGVRMIRAKRFSRTFLTLEVLLVGVVGVAQLQTQSSPPVQANESAESKPSRVRVSQGVAVAFLAKRVDPEYPKDLKKKGVQGLVTLKVLISREGDVSEVAAISGNPTLASLATSAVKQWKYKPYLLQGQPVEVETTVQINFTLSER